MIPRSSMLAFTFPALDVVSTAISRLSVAMVRTVQLTHTWYSLLENRRHLFESGMVDCLLLSAGGCCSCAGSQIPQPCADVHQICFSITKGWQCQPGANGMPVAIPCILTVLKLDWPHIGFRTGIYSQQHLIIIVQARIVLRGEEAQNITQTKVSDCARGKSRFESSSTSLCM